MSDFLVRVGTTLSSAGLAKLLRALYLPEERPVSGTDLSWLSWSATEEPGTAGANICSRDGAFCVWVGDLPNADSVVKALVDETRTKARGDSPPNATSVAKAVASAQPAGSFAMLLIDDARCAVVTDPMAGVQVYCAIGKDGTLAIGTHADLVAASAFEQPLVEPTSVADFLDEGTPCCPHTMYAGVFEIPPGQVVVLDSSGTETRAAWWRPPPEDLSLKLDEAAGLFAERWVASVRRRCHRGIVAVQLSGGMDSRAVMAAIPRDLPSAGFTFGDEINREAKTAERVAKAYARHWTFLKRDPEYLAHTADRATRFTGCEGEWHHAHAIGFEKPFRNPEISCVFTGLFMDNNFKGYYADDLVSIRRARGLMPPGHARKPLDYVHRASRWARNAFSPAIQDARVARRQAFVRGHFGVGRSSEWEWLDGHPVSQASDNTGWFVERRIFPLRLPVYDLSLVDLAFRIPATLKAGGRVFEEALRAFLGPAGRIPNANDGSLPNSSMTARHYQRLGRKVYRQFVSAMERLGRTPQVPHSWHDYRHYWKHSPVIADLLRATTPCLSEYDGVLNDGSLSSYLRDDSVSWRHNYRLLQLAVWTGWRRGLARTLATERGSARRLEATS